MVLMNARWKGRCRECGLPIQAGSLMDWSENGGGARHIDQRSCEAARAPDTVCSRDGHDLSVMSIERAGEPLNSRGPLMAHAPEHVLVMAPT